ncbi:MAG TPA: hypothetical protein VJ754_03435, partial [Anaerolineae bacterium]|nr:hypothetical protein [Anaerolineae bacterium]
MATRRTLPNRARWRYLAPLVAGVAALLYIVWSGAQAQLLESASLWPVFAIWVCLYAASRLLAVTITAGTFSFARVFLVAAFLVFDLPAALWIGLPGFLIDRVARSALRGRFGFEMLSARAALNWAGAALARVVFSLAVGALAYRAVGGRVPLTQVNIADIAPILVLFAAHALATLLIHLAPEAAARLGLAVEQAPRGRGHLLVGQRDAAAR